MLIPQLYRIDDKEHNIKPIPLTEEILLMCGFVNEVDEIDGLMYDISYVTGTNFMVEYLHVDKTWFFTDDIATKINIENLHQLQNLYYALTGKELEVKI